MKAQTPKQKAAARDELIERLFNSKLFKTGESFGTSEMSSVLGIQRQAANNLLNYLNDQRMIFLTKDNKNRLVCGGRKPAIAHQPWRKHTDAELGIK